MAVITNRSLPQVHINANHRTITSRQKRRQRFKIGTWNVRTLLDRENSNRPERRTAIVARELQRYDIDIAALSETRLADQGKLLEDGAGYTFFWSGLPKGSRREYGVGFAIANHILPRLSDEPNCINSRLMTIRIRLSRGQFGTFISIYAPTMTHTDEEKTEFYNQLSNIIQTTPASDRLFLLGDFTARVGRDVSTWRKIIGPYGIGSMNDNGQRLLSMCAAFDLSITNTWFNPGKTSVATWKHPRSGHGHLIDYIIIRQKDMKEVLMTKVMPGAECQTDHSLVRSKLRITLDRTHRRGSKAKGIKINVDKLQDPKVLSQFQATVASGLACTSVPTSTEEQWNRIKTHMKEAAYDLLGTDRKKQRDWFDENNNAIAALLNQKNIAHVKAINSPHNPAAQESFRATQKELLKGLRKMKNDWWLKMSAEIQYYADNRRSKEFYGALKAIYGPRYQSIQMIEDPVSEQKITKSEDIVAAWKTHFSALLNRPTDVNWTQIDRMQQHEIKMQLDQFPTRNEMQIALAQLRNGKAPGEDGLPAELFKLGGTVLHDEIMKLLKTIWETEQVPQDFKDATIIPLYKGKGSRQNTNNYRGISILSVAGKILARILLNRLNSEILNEHVPEEQCGFRNGRSTIDLIFAARQIQEKCREKNQPLYALFVDFTKAFDSVDRDALWTVLGKLGCPPKFINIVKSLHFGMRARVRHCGTTSTDFTVDTGVKQGCVLAPTLFSLYLTAICMEAFRNSEDGVPIQYRLDGHLFNSKRFLAKTRLHDAKVRMLLFADDCALFAHSEAELQRLTTDFASVACDFGLEINTSKTLVFYQPVSEGGNQIPKIRVKENSIDCCSNFCYLGSVLSADLTIDKELNTRIAKASSAFGKLRKRLWQNHNIKTDTKMAVYRAIVLSTLLYGSETWTIYKRHIRLLDRFHQYCLRQILRIHWTDRVSNTQVLQKSKMSGIEAFLIRNQLRWAGHVKRMSDGRLPKQLLFGQLKNGSRKRGRPKLRYTDTLQVSLKNSNLGCRSWETLAMNRATWRKAIYEGVMKFEVRRVSALEHKRAIRKHPNPSLGVHADGLTCSTCGKRCMSRIGLIGHQRTHAVPLAKR